MAPVMHVRERLPSVDCRRVCGGEAVDVLSLAQTLRGVPVAPAVNTLAPTL